MSRLFTRRRPRVDVYTDGACSGSPGPGGWAWAVATTPPGYGPEGSGSAPATTNQRMELQAALEAIRCNYYLPICIVTDSAYVMNCFVDKWHLTWKDGRKKNGRGNPVSNWDLWEPLIDLVLRGDITWRKVKGHSGDPMNDYVDMLAVRAKRAGHVARHR